MAHRKNPRLLRSSKWRKPVFSIYRNNKHAQNSWAKKIKTTPQRLLFWTKLFQKKSLLFGKKRERLLKQTHRRILCSHYKTTRFPLLSLDRSKYPRGNFLLKRSQIKEKPKKKGNLVSSYIYININTLFINKFSFFFNNQKNKNLFSFFTKRRKTLFFRKRRKNGRMVIAPIWKVGSSQGLLVRSQLFPKKEERKNFFRKKERQRGSSADG